MRLIVADKERLRQFIRFYEERYLNDPLKRNSMSGLLKSLLYGKSIMCRSSYLEPVLVEENGEILMIAVLAQVERMKDFLQVAFFEAKEKNSEAFGLILSRAEELAKEKGAGQITGSLNVHVNYGLGFLASGYYEKQGFGTMHNPPFYNELFEENGFRTIDMVSFRKDLKELSEILDPRITERLKRRYTIRSLDYRNLERDAEVYTNVNNEAFSDHLFYYPRKAEEDLELFKDFKPLLKPQNLLFAYKGDKPVGFMLWYPDFNELMRPDETLGLGTVIKNRIFGKRIRTVKIVEMGVLPSEQRYGAVLALLNRVFEICIGKYDTFESGWILESNDSSRMLGVKMADSVYKRYKAYIKEVRP